NGDWIVHGVTLLSRLRLTIELPGRKAAVIAARVPAGAVIWMFPPSVRGLPRTPGNPGKVSRKAVDFHTPVLKIPPLSWKKRVLASAEAARNCPHQGLEEVGMSAGPPDPREFGKYFAFAQVGLEMVAPIVLGMVIDNYFDTGPWGVTFGTIL